MRKILTILIIICFPLVGLCAAINGKVVQVIDGDTLWVVSEDKQRHKIRLWGVDAPELNQSWGSQSKRALDTLVGDKQVKCELIERDKFKRQVAIVYLGQLDINQLMVATGNAWVFRYYNKEKYYQDEKQARDSRQGLWRLPKSERIPPWKWRRA